MENKPEEKEKRTKKRPPDIFWSYAGVLYLQDLFLCSANDQTIPDEVGGGNERTLAQ